MTANAMAGDREKVIDAGMNDHIAKPIDFNLMFLTLAKWITPANPEAEEVGQVADKKEESTPDTGERSDLSQLDGIDIDKG